MFTNDQINDGAKLSRELLRRVEREDPRVAIIAAATTLVAACKATTIKRDDLLILLDRITNVFNGDVQLAAQAGMRNLWVP